MNMNEWIRRILLSFEVFECQNINLIYISVKYILVYTLYYCVYINVLYFIHNPKIY